MTIWKREKKKHGHGQREVGVRGDLPCQTDAVGVDAEALREDALNMDVAKPEHHVTEAC
jgi:hypothetical protein